MYTYKTKGTCSMEIHFDIKDNKVYNVEFVGGCPGNTVGVARLVEGMDKDKVIELLENTPCRNRGTSCPDQLAKALKEVTNE